ncbi:helix-turn-helix domain-containing protein [Clostridium botulinum]|uniref:Helix-turn-helix domain-containing protein n=1 Tax=Clostridium botulinum TaxID=1491 RepID=A0ABD7CG31_CLOBO|nr:helix-turn-helix domain-containing protein [Clostridium botulinum]KGO13530.1 DNA-binding protein [Clostridium botulinum]MCC5416326.1 helix-turn-helix domain-containing protein [Clostridium botulinum]MCC5422460.1 helix-turn-helix domain-containing protein [Clostridium botulinum]NCI18554.1 helix-turn-helix domain-containing protein [Clostridium botulinum]NCI37160.1 helix-turn-helix domain-containing protein [Clostridium botulinum]
MINRKLKSLRAKHGDTQKDLADFLGVRVSTFNFKENGKTDFTLNEAYKISQKYNSTIEEIFFTKYDVKTTTGTA